MPYYLLVSQGDGCLFSIEKYLTVKTISLTILQFIKQIFRYYQILFFCNIITTTAHLQAPNSDIFGGDHNNNKNKGLQLVYCIINSENRQKRKQPNLVQYTVLTVCCLALCLTLFTTLHLVICTFVDFHCSYSLIKISYSYCLSWTLYVTIHFFNPQQQLCRQYLDNAGLDNWEAFLECDL